VTAARRAGELAAIGIGLAVFGYLGWDGAMWDPRFQLALHVAGIVAIGGLVWIGLAGGSLPRSRLEVPLLALLLAFAVSGLSAWNTGLAAGALAAILGNALMLPVAALALRHRPGMTALVVTGAVLALAVGALLVIASRRLDWVVAGGPGLPPLRMARESTVFGSVAVPPFVLMAALPLALLVPHPRARFWGLAALAALAVPLTIFSGSRSAWLAMSVAAIVLFAPPVVERLRGLGRARPWSRDWWTPRRAGLAILLAMAALAFLLVVAPRLTDLRSLVYRGYLWRDTIVAWSQDPLFGIGPGSMPWARQAAAPPLSFPVRQPHSHDIPLGILGDAGLVGLGAALALFLAFVVLAGPWRTRTLHGRAAFAVLMGFAIGMLFEDLTFLPGFNLLVVLLAALALMDAGSVRWQPLRQPMRWRWLAAPPVGAVALVVVAAFGDASAVAYRQGTDAAAEGRWPAAYEALHRAEGLNPWHPSGPRALAVAADRVGEPHVARAAAARAVELSPGEGPSWTNLALLCMADGDRTCAREAADRAVDAATPEGRELANAALVYDWLGDPTTADSIYRLSLLTNYWTGLTLPWPRTVLVGDGRADEQGVDAAELNLLIARRLNDERIRVDDYAGLVPRALAYAMLGERASAVAEAERATRVAPETPIAWDIAALLTAHYGGDPAPLVAIGDAARGTSLARGPARLPGVIFDIASFRAYPADGLVMAAERLLPETPWPWVLEPLLAPAAAP
jgi:tetratricopeptide (TPR) repeat protein